MWIQTCFFPLQLNVAKVGTPSRYTKLRAIAGGEDRPFRRGLWNIGVISRLPSIRLLMLIFSRKVGESLEGGLSPSARMISFKTEHSFPQFRTPPSTFVSPFHIYRSFMLSDSLYCLYGFLLIIINQIHRQEINLTVDWSLVIIPR